jgi:hypothetical protein
MSLPEWWPAWEGETIVIVAGGPSARDADLELVRVRARLIVINNAWLLAPWADILYACDEKWWQVYKGAVEFKGLKLSVDKNAPKHAPNVRLLNCMKPDDRFFAEPGTVGWGGNGGFHCLNLAAQFKPRKIVLVGYDMHLRNGLHWHGKHPNGMNNPSPKNVERWRRAVDGAAKPIAKLGITVINTSPNSALQKYPKMSLAEAMEC